MVSKLAQISAEPVQEHTLVLDNDEEVKFTLTYKANVRGWYFDIDYPARDFQLAGQRLAAFPNILRQYKNIVPFGLACFLEDGTEPLFLNDFSTNRAEIFILTEDDVQVIEDQFSPENL